MRVAVLLIIYIGVLISRAFAEDDLPQTLRLEFKAELVTRYAREEGKPKLPDGRAESKLEVWLSPWGFTVSRATGIDVYDLRSKRVESYSRSGAGPSAITLDAQVDFRRLESYNRTRMREMLAASGQKQPALLPFAIETMFGMERKKGALAGLISKSEEDGVIRFTVGGEVVLAVVRGEEPAPKRFRASWARFVRHRLRIHPLIQAELLALTNLPKEMNIRWANLGRTYRQNLKLIHSTEAHRGPPQLPPPGFDRSDPLARALDAAKKVVPTTKKDMRRRVWRLEQSGEWLGALLFLFEYSIATGDQVGAEMRSLVERAADTGELRRLIARLPELNDPEKAGAFREALGHLRQREPRYGHLIDIWRANASVTLGEPHVAKDLLLGVLEDHPEMAGAWSDLGWIYHRSIKVDDAWRCFTAGLKIAPKHPMLAPVVKLKESFRKSYPQFYD